MGELGEARARLVLALDDDDLGRATAAATALAPFFATVKVGLELFAAAGPQAFAVLGAAGFALFADLKLHDIPTTVERAARVIGREGVALVTLHTAGGAAMLRAGVEGLAAGAAEAGVAPPRALGVTVLTSEAQAPVALLTERARLAEAARCAGVVCAAPDLAVVRAAAPGLLSVVPGIRLAGAPAHDQARVATPAQALAVGADLLVCGRAVLQAPDPEAAAASLCAQVAEALRDRA